MDPDDWALVGIAAGISTATATVFSLMLSLLWRALDRKRADWVTFDARTTWTSESPPSAAFELANTGDGSAFAVRVEGLGCHAQLRGEWNPNYKFGPSRSEFSMVPAMHPGETVHVIVHCEPDEWVDAELAVVWTVSPTWMKRFSRKIEYSPLPSVAEPPEWSGYGPDESAPPEGPMLSDIYRAQRESRPSRWHFGQRRRLSRDMRRI